MAIVKFRLDPDNPPRLTAEQRARLDAMTDEEIERAAESDPDNPPWTDEELARGVAGRRVRLVRTASGLSQAAFAERYRINLARLRDWEQGRTMPDSAALAYLAVIEREPDAVMRALASDMAEAPAKG
jgi:putative transcriptional regulator